MGSSASITSQHDATGHRKPAGEDENLISEPHKNVRRGYYELAIDLDLDHRISAAFTELALAI